MNNTRSGIREDAKATYTRNRTDTESDLGKYIKDDRLAIMGTKNKTNAELSLKRHTGDNGFAIIDAKNRMNTRLALRKDIENNRSVDIINKLATKDDRLVIRNDRSAIDNNRLAIIISKRIDINDGLDT